MAKDQNQQTRAKLEAQRAKAKQERSVRRGARINNAIVGAAAGSFLGGQLHGGASGYKGARVGGALGALYGGLSNPKKRAEIEKLQTAAFSTPASRIFDFSSVQDRAERRDQVRTGAAVAAGAAGTAAGAYGAMAARKASKQAAQFTPQAVVRAAGQQATAAVKGKAQKVAKEYFPTFTKAGKKVAEVMKRKVALTPARKVFFFGNKEQLKDVDNKTYASPLKVAAGLQKGYFRVNSDGTPIKTDVPVMHAQVVNAAVRKASKVSKWAGRAGGVAKDAADVVRGKPREKDASGRSKKREWEKSWFKEGARRAAIAGGILAGAKVMKDKPEVRRWVVKKARKAGEKVNQVVPGAFGLSARYVTPASRVICFEDEGKRFKKVVKNPETGRSKTVRYGQAGNASDGKDRIRPGTAKGDAYCARSANIKGDWKSDPNSPNNLSRKKWKCVGSVSKRSFSTPASRLYEFDYAAADAGWDVRDPRGRSARVFAPGAGKRDRREKRWHERAENERKLWKAAVVGAGVAGVASGRLLRGGKLKSVAKGAKGASVTATAKAAPAGGGYSAKRGAWRDVPPSKKAERN